MACTPAAQFWALALSPGSLHFVDTADNFKQVEEAFRRAVVVGLDAEWKPVISSSSRRKGGGGGGGGGGHASSPSPRVSILQVACRLGPSSREVAASASPVDGVNNFSAGLCSQKNGESSALLCSVKGTQEIDLGGTGREGGNGGALALAQLSYRGTLEREKAGDGDDQSEAGAGAGASSTGTGGDAGVTGDGGGGQQGSEVNVVFVLDMLALTPGVFAGPLKELLRSPAVLKLGYGLRDDMRHLAASHPGGDAKGCFDVVEPYVDVGRLYRRLHLNLTPDAQHQPGGAARRDRARAFVMTGGLSAVAEAVLGSPLDKELQCSNWEDRPLTAGQLAYAAADVCCLLSIFDAFCRSAQSPPAPGSPRATWPSLSSSPPFSFSEGGVEGGPSEEPMLPSSLVQAPGVPSDDTCQKRAGVVGRGLASILDLADLSLSDGGQTASTRPLSTPPPGASQQQGCVESVRSAPTPLPELHARRMHRPAADVAAHAASVAGLLRPAYTAIACAPGGSSPEREESSRAEGAETASNTSIDTPFPIGPSSDASADVSDADQPRRDGSSQAGSSPGGAIDSELLHADSWRWLGAVASRLVMTHGERLSLHEAPVRSPSSGSNSTHGHLRKKKSKKGRRSGCHAERGQASGSTDEDAELAYRGVPPWDPSLGGDGVPRFLCDAMVEGLARQLRCVGIDTASPPPSRQSDARQLVERAEREGRVLLTRDVKLLRRRLLPRHLAYCVRNLAKQEQLKEVIEVFQLSISEGQLLSRCIRCNGEFSPAPLDAELATARAPPSQVVPPCVLESVAQFWQCSACNHLYWEGSQYDRAVSQFVSICKLGPNGNA